MFKIFEKSMPIFALIALCQAEPPRFWQAQRLSFPGPVNNRPLPFLAHQEEAPLPPPELAPYPPAGLKPEPAFELPAPTQVYGPPEQTYGPPEQTYGPPEQTYVPPEQTYGPPEQTYGTPAETYGPPSPPPPSSAITDNNALPQSASIIAPSTNLFPQTQLTLPLPDRLTAFRPQRRPAALRQRPNGAKRPAAKLRRPPAQPHPAKLVLSFSS